MPDLAKLSPVILAYLRPFPGHRDDVKREFAALAKSVWENEDKTRCYYWLYPEDKKDEMRVIEIYNGPEGMEIHATGDLTCEAPWKNAPISKRFHMKLIEKSPATVDTFQRSHQYGIRVDMEGLQRRKQGLPEIPPKPGVEIRGLDIDYLQPVQSIPSFLGPPKLNEAQVVLISIITIKKGKRAHVSASLNKLAQHSKQSLGQTFWVNEDTQGTNKFWVIQRFASDSDLDKFGNDGTVRELQAEPSQLTEKTEIEKMPLGQPRLFPEARANIVRVQSAAVRQGKEKGVRLNTVSPGFIATPMLRKELGTDAGGAIKAMIVDSPVPRAGTVSDVANVVAFLTSAEAAFINGVDIIVDGGLVSGQRWGPSSNF
ncbi:hypothetical protein CEP52_013141 [Fusarium oligoseptatum]|uniref:ABM domain-containing protein n=1 Tax=Fusarium oligoseptatum TaxID=2604345 RepID=A0A428SVF3_9HYPO|nr:hypothetical protein CEP52_013141 [Fusarium oligoseptatum]